MPTPPETCSIAARRRAAPAPHSARAARFASLSTATGRPARGAIAQRGGEVDAGQVEVRRAHEHRAVEVDQAGRRDADAVRRARRPRSAASPAPSRRRRPASRAPRAPRRARTSPPTCSARGARGRRGRCARGRRRARRRSRRAPCARGAMSSPGRPTRPRERPACSTRPRPSSSATRLETVERIRPVLAAIAARDCGPSASSRERTRARLARRTSPCARASPSMRQAPSKRSTTAWSRRSLP